MIIASRSPKDTFFFDARTMVYDTRLSQGLVSECLLIAMALLRQDDIGPDYYFTSRIA